VQGGGAIISVAFAAIADHIDAEKRTTAMAVLGIPIGASFVVGVIGGPILALFEQLHSSSDRLPCAANGSTVAELPA
jgi:MFS family permease